MVFYQIYIDQDPAQLDKLIHFARLNSRLVLGVDINLYPPCIYQEGRSWGKQIIFVRNFILHYFKWYSSHLMHGRLIIPVGFFVNLLDFLNPFPGVGTSLCHTRMSEFYKSNRSEYTSELMATYVRLISGFYEEFGVERFVPWIMARFLFRERVYRAVLLLLFQLKPKCYVTWQRTYLPSYLPCLMAVRRGVAVVYLGSADQSPVKLSRFDVCRDWNWPTYSCCADRDAFDSNQLSASRLIASDRIRQRIYGGSVDTLIRYMKINPYYQAPSIHADVSTIIKNANLRLAELDSAYFEGGFVGVYMHEFNDYHFNGVLPDFASSYYEWLLITCQILVKNEVPFVVKVHPAALADPSQEKFQRSLRSLALLSQRFDAPLNLVGSMSTTKLLDFGMKVGCTVRGTIATELVYLKCPVICAGQPPYMNFLPSRIFNEFGSYSFALQNYASCAPIVDDEFNANLDFLALTGQSIEVPAVSDDCLQLSNELGIVLPPSLFGSRTKD